MDQNNSETKNLDTTVVKKMWENPTITEISKHEILQNQGSGGDGGQGNGNSAT